MDAGAAGIERVNEIKLTEGLSVRVPYGRDASQRPSRRCRWGSRTVRWLICSADGLELAANATDMKMSYLSSGREKASTNQMQRLPGVVAQLASAWRNSVFLFLMLYSSSRCAKAQTAHCQTDDQLARR